MTIPLAIEHPIRLEELELYTAPIHLEFAALQFIRHRPEELESDSPPLTLINIHPIPA